MVNLVAFGRVSYKVTIYFAKTKLQDLYVMHNQKLICSRILVTKKVRHTHNSNNKNIHIEQCKYFDSFLTTDDNF